MILIALLAHNSLDELAVYRGWKNEMLMVDDLFFTLLCFCVYKKHYFCPHENGLKDVER